MATKEAYQKKLEAQIKEWDAKLDLLNAKIQKATADARINYENELENLRNKRAAVYRMLQDMGERSEDTWEDIKKGTEKAWEDMNRAIEKMMGHFK